MFSSNLKNNIDKIYLKVCDNSCEVFIDIDKFTEFIEYIKKINNVKIILDTTTLKYKNLNELIECLNLSGLDYIIHCNDYNDFVYLNNIYYMIYNLTLHVPGDLGNTIYRSDNINYVNLYHKLQNLNIHNVLNFTTTIFIDKKNAYKIYETLSMLSKFNISSYLYIKDYTRSVNYDNPNLTSVINCLQPSIGYRLALDNIIDNKELLISNRRELNFIYNNLDKKDLKCKINSDLNFISINEKFQIRLCNNIEGKKCSQLNPFECIDDNGHPTEKFLDYIKEDYKDLCCGCNCYQKYNERSV